MVRIIQYQKRKSEDDREFFVLVVQSGIEVVKSQNGGMYLTAKKATIPSTFNEDICQSLIGQELAGSIVRVECEPYEFVIPETSEIITRNHRYEYSPENESGTISSFLLSKTENSI
ncbi:hypothetical protein ACFOWA_00070 [Pedobacter lithocola]|uniref:Uncharacterized protein n=1 Tax=Pedobacter lithocola TaxID=1908239 RepID=A0ABV8P5S1_9SPHI